MWQKSQHIIQCGAHTQESVAQQPARHVTPDWYRIPFVLLAMCLGEQDLLITDKDRPLPF